MDKNQAIDFIVRQYTLGYGAEEIAQQISQQMNAPLPLVSKFVAATIDQAFPNQPVPPPAPLPDFYTTSPDQPADGYDYASGSPASPPAEDFVDLDADGIPATPDFYSPSEAASYPPVNPDLGMSDRGDSYSRAYAAAAAPMAQPMSTFNPADLPQPVAQAPGVGEIPASEADLRALENDPEVEALVLRELGKTTKVSDVVMLMCERHGLDWKQSQRLVARIQSRNRKKLAGRQNRIIFPLCITAILGGGGLVIAGVAEFLRLRALYLSGSPAATVALMNSSVDYIRAILPLVLTGLALAIGGVFGLVKAIQNQSD